MKKRIKSKKLWTLIVITLAAAYYLFFQFKTPQEETPLEVAIEKAPLALKHKSTNITDSATSVELPDSQWQCKKFTRGYYEKNRTWQFDMQETAESWLSQGFSSDEIAYAIEHFRNTNYSQNWLVKHLIKNARATKENQTLTNQITNFLGRELPDGMSIEKQYPIKNLIGYQQMNDTQRQAAIKVEAPTVDDIVAFIKAKELSEQDILELLKHVENPNEVIASNGTREPIYLLEFAIAFNRYNVVDVLLKRGVQPMSNTYLKNALELALQSVYYALDNDKEISMHIPLIKKLAALNLTARHSMLENGNIEAWSGLLSYKFTAGTIVKIEEEYGLDLLSLGRPIEYKAQLFNTQLISQLEQLNQDFLAEEYSGFPYKQAQQNCQQLENKISSVWQPSAWLDIAEIDQLIQKHAGDTNLVNAELALRDPDYIDCLQKRESNIRKGHEERSELGKSYYAQNSRNKGWLINFIQSENFTKNELTWIFHESLSSFKLEETASLIDQGITPDYLDFRKFIRRMTQQEELHYLDSNGIDIKSVDKYGKTMLYYAVKKNRLDLVKYMLAEGYSFHGNSGSQDPLHLLLASWKFDYSQTKTIEMLPWLMSFQPKIDNFHLSRMKLLELTDNDIYLSIIEQFPSLRPEENTPYPDAACNS